MPRYYYILLDQGITVHMHFVYTKVLVLIDGLIGHPRQMYMFFHAYDHGEATIYNSLNFLAEYSNIQR